MKTQLLFLAFTVLFFSCRKEEVFKPDDHIVYDHWYKLSGSSDTLFSVYLPNAFSPNGDGINDTFYPRGNFDLDRFSVFYRDGKLIFETANINRHWDGRDHYGPVLPATTYVYQLIVKDSMGIAYEYEGSVLIYR